MLLARRVRQITCRPSTIRRQSSESYQHGLEAANALRLRLKRLNEAHDTELIRIINTDPAFVSVIEQADKSIPEVPEQSTENPTHSASVPEGERPPSLQDLRQYALVTSVPFIGFGFFDNAIMLLAGDFFDIHLGVTLGISTLASAALGNSGLFVFFHPTSACPPFLKVSIAFFCAICGFIDNFASNVYVCVVTIPCYPFSP
jgi:hypothetical protein